MKVYPTNAAALAVWHPSDPAKRLKLRSEGVDWPGDGFTFRMIVQDIATEDPAKAFNPDAPAPVVLPPSTPSKKEP